MRSENIQHELVITAVSILHISEVGNTLRIKYLSLYEYVNQKEHTFKKISTFYFL